MIITRKRPWASGMLALSLTPGAALAAQGAAQVAESGPVIVVTAPSAGDATLLEDTPANAQVLRGDPLTGQGHATLADLLDASLGSVSLSNGSGSPYQSDVSYRGFQATSLLGSPTGLSVWLDGVRMNEAFGGNVNWDLIPMNALAAVEVLPGSNPLFGLNTLGGSLVLVPRNGADNGGIGATLEVGAFGRHAMRGEAGGRLAGLGADWFVAGNLDAQDGYRDYSNQVVRQLYGKLRWHRGATNVDLSTIWASTNLHGTQALPLSMLARPQMAYTWPDYVANRQLIINLKAATELARALRLSGNLYVRHSTAYSLNSNAGEADACGDTRDCTSSAVGGSALDLYQANPYAAGTPAYAAFTPYGGALPIHDYTSNINASLAYSYTGQTVFGGNLLFDIDRSLGGLDNDLNLGGSFETARIDYTQNTVLAQLVGYQTVPMAWNAQYGSAAGFEGSALIGNVALASRNDALNLFLRDMLKPTRTLSLSGSLAFTVTRVRLAGANSTFLGADGGYSWTGADWQTFYNPAYLGAQYWDGSSLATAAAPAGGVAGPEIAPLSGVHSYRRLNPAVGLAWNPARGAGVFASYTEAMRAPTAIELACADPSRPCALPTGFNGDPNLAAVIAKTLEVGTRGKWGHFGWNASLYRTRLSTDIQFIYTSSGLGYFANVGQSERRGAEVSLNADLARVHLGLSYGLVRATYLTGFVDASGDMVSPGSRIPGIAGQSLKLRATYAPSKAVMVGANVIAVGAQYAHGDEANRYAPVPGYALVNLDGHVEVRSGVALYAHVTNLFDRHYATFGVMGSNIYTGADEQFRTPAPGRGFMLGVRLGGGRDAAGDSD